MPAPSVANVFTPASEIEDVRLFAGRVAELQALALALESVGAQVVIYGNRGIGKSSLARFLERLSTNERDAIDRLKTKPSRGFDFLPVFFRCDDSIRTVPQLLLRLLTDDGALAPWVPFKVIEKEGSTSIQGKLDVKVFSLGGDRGSSITEAAQVLDTDVVSVFINAVRALLKSGIARDGLLLIIDESDRISDRTGLASLMKTLSAQGVKFALVGVATTVQDLIQDHESIARQLADGTVHLPPMSGEEINEIFDRAEAVLDHKFSFSPEARHWIATISRGHPFYVHLVGKHSLLKTIEAGGSVVTFEFAEMALRDIALKGSAPIQESLYKTAIGHSHIRESVLKAFAADEGDEVHTTELYALLAVRLNIDPGAISVYVGQLVSEKYGAVLVKTRERYYSFRDSLFKAYAAARPWELRPGDKEDE